MLIISPKTQFLLNFTEQHICNWVTETHEKATGLREYYFCLEILLDILFLEGQNKLWELNKNDCTLAILIILLQSQNFLHTSFIMGGGVKLYLLMLIMWPSSMFLSFIDW